MVKEVYEIMNNTRGPVSFTLFPNQSAEELNLMPGHHRRRAIRSAGIPVTIPHGIAYDLVKETGLSIEEIKNSPEFHQLKMRGKLSVVTEDAQNTVEEVAPLPPPPVEEEPVEEELVEEEESVEEELVEEEESVEEESEEAPVKKSKSRSKKKVKK